VQAASYVRGHQVAPQESAADRPRRGNPHEPGPVRELGANDRIEVVSTHLGAPPPLAG
jgi:hypothetical protein